MRTWESSGCVFSWGWGASAVASGSESFGVVTVGLRAASESDTISWIVGDVLSWALTDPPIAASDTISKRLIVFTAVSRCRSNRARTVAEVYAYSSVAGIGLHRLDLYLGEVRILDDFLDVSIRGRMRSYQGSRRFGKVICK